MPSWSEERAPDPEWPLIIPWAAKKSFIFSRNAVTLLFSFGDNHDEIPGIDDVNYTRSAYLEPVRALLAKAKALKAETDACFAPSLPVRPLVTFLDKRTKGISHCGEGGGRER
jgi:hypothetical protein